MAIQKVLAANRGEIARRVFRTCHQLGIATVAVFSDPDATAPHTGDADEAVRLPGESPTDTYLNIDRILAAAKETGADAVHPGYGFLSENAGFARSVVEAGLIWIGPSPESIEIMGSKLESKKLIQSVGVPALPSLELEGLPSVEDAAMSIGFPVLVKASAGGGGKGMRIVGGPDELLDAIESAKREAAGAFGDDTVFLEKYLEAPRHIEIQVFGDQHGNVISLGERECSIQRRHQKIIEESPSPILDDDTRSAMSDAAIKAAMAVDYVGAGTVEFLYQDNHFFFLEMNTRLQVEHPVTEMVTGLDLVRLQIEVADGAHLPTEPAALDGHAIEARLYAEDPLNGFLPVIGRFHRFEFEEESGLRVDSGIESGSEVSVHYDPMIAKVIAHAPTREGAAAKLASALRHGRIHGSTTNRALLVRTLEHPEFTAGQTDTHFLERNEVSKLGRPLAGAADELIAAIAAALADQIEARSGTPVLTSLPSGWRNSLSQLQHRAYAGHHGTYAVVYSTDPSGFDAEGLGHVVFLGGDADRVEFSIEGEPHRAAVARYGPDRWVDGESGPALLTEVPRFPLIDRDEDAGSLHAPMPGKVIRVDVAEGDAVTEGQVLVVLEAMKMEHTLRSPHTGTVTAVRHDAEDQVEADAILVVVEEG
ncbi:MAG: biotin carboxylase N-terminal domain-containing protein [Actinomycetota bacterium]|nr:biotin carboxylase N-terminal domain-containing protein [Actinomycetota bacterium]